MIKLPKEILKALQTIESAGYSVCAAGDSVCRGLLGAETEMWELLSAAPADRVRELLGSCEADEDDASVLYVTQGELVFAVTCGKDLERELLRRGFTICAMGDNPSTGLLDPAGGKKDLEARLVRCIGDPQGAFRKNPLLILQAISLAADLDFDIEMQTFEEMKSAAESLAACPKPLRNQAFMEIFTSAHPARGLRFAVAAGIMPILLGDQCYPPKSQYEIERFNTLMENFDMVREGDEYRFVTLLMCFEEKRALAGIEHMQLPEDMAERYGKAIKMVQDLYFIVRPHDFKRFLYQNGMENYEYWENLAKQQRKVYDQPENRIFSRYYMLQEFQQYKMAIFPEDLAVNLEDLRALGIEGEKADMILEKLLYIVHYKPRFNTREKLLSEAKRVKRNPFAGFLRDIHFVR